MNIKIIYTLCRFQNGLSDLIVWTVSIAIVNFQIQLHVLLLGLGIMKESYQLSVGVSASPPRRIVLETKQELHQQLLDIFPRTFVLHTLLCLSAMRRVLIAHVYDQVLVQTDI